MAHTAAPVTLTRANRTRISGGTLGRTTVTRPATTRPGSGRSRIAIVASTPNAANSANGSTSRAGAHSASIPASERPGRAPAGLRERGEQRRPVLLGRRVELDQRRGRRPADHPHRQPLHGARREQPRQGARDGEQHEPARGGEEPRRHHAAGARAGPRAARRAAATAPAPARRWRTRRSGRRSRTRTRARRSHTAGWRRSRPPSSRTRRPRRPGTPPYGPFRPPRSLRGLYAAARSSPSPVRMPRHGERLRSGGHRCRRRGDRP